MKQIILKTLAVAMLTLPLAACNDDSNDKTALFQPSTPAIDLTALLAKVKNGTVLPANKLLLATKDGDNQDVKVMNGGYGSDGFINPNDPTQFYALTDRGPNGDVVHGVSSIQKGQGKAFPVPDFTPSIALFQINPDGSISLVKTITLKRPNGTNMTGLPNPVNGATQEVAYTKNDTDNAYDKLLLVNPNMPYDKDTNPTKTDPYGIDSEGLAVMKDGTFWVSDEYGPHIVHFDANGKEIERINAFITGEGASTYKVNGNLVTLPTELSNRRANRGMEGLTVTPDQQYLVGIMQSALLNPDKTTQKANLTRIVRINLKTGGIEQFIYQQTDGDSNCGIVAIDQDTFYVIERDGEMPRLNPNAVKKIFKISLKGATNLQAVTPTTDIVKNPTLGLTIAGKTLEQTVLMTNGWTTLQNNGIVPVSKSLYLDAVKTLNYPHDKLETVMLFPNGALGLLNDDDFAISPQDKNNQDFITQKYLDNTSKEIDSGRLYIYPAH